MWLVQFCGMSLALKRSWYRLRIVRLIRKRPNYFSTLRCPNCGKTSRDQMPGNSSVRLYHCLRCNGIVRPRKGDRCVYCSYGDVPCPPRQSGMYDVFDSRV